MKLKQETLKYHLIHSQKLNYILGLKKKFKLAHRLMLKSIIIDEDKKKIKVL